MESLSQLEAACETLYNSKNSAERAEAQSALKCFAENTDYIIQCQYILDNASTPYALILASSSLLKQVTEHSLPLHLRIDIRNYLMKYLADRGPDLEQFVLGSLIQLFCRVTKLGWLDDDRFREVVKGTMDFLSQAPRHYAIGLMILNQLVSEMNEPKTGLLASMQRRIASNFRDESLFQIFGISLTSLNQVKHEVGGKLQELSLTLALKCLSFDFMGTSYDESSDDIGSIQIPITWRPVIEDPSTLQIFFDYYAITQSYFSKEALECLVRMASIRRSLFTDDSTRKKFLAHLMTGTKEILQNEIGLSEHENYHVYCRLLGRFKANYQLSELISDDSFGDWIHLVAEFTLKSLQSWKWANTSIFYLLGLWSRLVSSVRYLKSDMPNKLHEYAPKIIEVFISSRFDSLLSEGDGLSENPLDNVELLQDQLDFFPSLCRFQYESFGGYIVKEMETLMASYMAATLKTVAYGSELSLTEGKLAWIVHIVAAILRTNQNGTGGESQEIFDAELSARIFQLISFMDTGLLCQRYGELSRERLDRAIVVFFQLVKRSYIGDQAMHSSKFYGLLSKGHGIHDHLMLLNSIAAKIAINLKSYPEGEEVINETLGLFLELASGYMTGKLLLKLDRIEFIIKHHKGEHFPLLEDRRSGRSRTTFYYTIGLLIFMEDSVLKFRSSMDSLLQVAVSLESTTDSMFRSDTVKHAFIGLMRDLKGIAMATNSRRTYGVFFDWVYPARIPLLMRGIIYWADTPEVTTPLLKFIAELVLNKSQRLTFHSSSANGILLFREVSKLIVAYGSRILSLAHQVDVYAAKYKGIWICLTILTRALSGNYINFGVFELYGDTALVDALNIALKMTLSIPLSDILTFQKLMLAYFAFLEALVSNHMGVVSSLDTSTFIYLIGSLGHGLKSLNTTVSSQCASAVDSLATFYFEHISLGDQPTSSTALNLARHISDCPSILTDILKTLFEIILFEDPGNQWSLSRAMLSLILISEEMFTNVKALILASQQMEQQQRLNVCFEKLMTDIGQRLDSKNRDSFAQNLTRFKNEFRSK